MRSFFITDDNFARNKDWRRKFTSPGSAGWKRSGKAKRRESASQLRFVFTGWRLPGTIEWRRCCA
jgi:hypothetical protein